MFTASLGWDYPEVIIGLGLPRGLGYPEILGVETGEIGVSRREVSQQGINHRGHPPKQQFPSG